MLPLSYETIGVNSIDLILLDDSLRDEFMDRLSKLRESIVIALTTELQINKLAIESMLEDGVLMVDENSEEYKELKSKLDIYKDKYSVTDGSFDFNFDDDNLEPLEQTNDFGLEDNEDLFAAFTKDNILEGYAPKDKTLKQELAELAKEIDEEAPDVQRNFLLHMQKDCERLPVVFKETPEDLTKVQKFARDTICLVAKNIYKAPIILNEIYQYHNRIMTTDGIVSNFRFTGINSLVPELKNLNSIITSSNYKEGAVRRARQINNKIKAKEIVQQTVTVSEEMKSAVRRDVITATSKNYYEQLVKNDKMYNMLLYYYRFYYYTKKVRVEAIYDGDENTYLELECDVAKEILNEYGLIGFLPQQYKELIKSISILGEPMTNTVVSIGEPEKCIFKILRNAYLSEKRFVTRRQRW